MSDDIEKEMPEKQVKIYLAILGGLLVVAVLLTVFTAVREGNQVAEKEESVPKIEKEEQVLQKSEENRPVQHNFADANSKIEKNEEPAESLVTEETGQVEEKAGTSEEEWEAEPEAVVEEPPQITAYFNPETDLMVWPVSGVVLMDYSPDALIYDETLDLFRTNASISLGAADAEEVVAAANGIVTEIGKNDEIGHYVVLDNGNGYETTYGQLAEETVVETGQTVAQGEVIGTVSEPTWYSEALGTHMTFTVKVNGETVNPLDYLENVLED